MRAIPAREGICMQKVRAEIDLGAIRANARRFAALANGAALCAVVKADAYGHGAAMVAHALRGVAGSFAVALVSEGAALRHAGVAEDILALVPPLTEEEALSLGVNTRLMRAIAVTAASLMTASSVAVSGIIGWVGLVIPHVTRMLTGPDARWSIPSSMLLGSAFLTAVDTVARTASYQEIPIGILTSFIGAPFFLYLIIREGRRNEA